MEQERPTLLCFAHLNWDHVWQRPQQLMSRFTRYCRVIYFDPPLLTPGSGDPFLWKQQSEAGVERYRPIFAQNLIRQAGWTYQEQWLRLLPQAIELAGPTRIAWFFSPRGDYLAEAARPEVKVSVYDCMDDLASFADGGEELYQREDRLLAQVDLLTTGGYSMYTARKDRHPHAYCFPSGVDIDHYRKVLDPSLREHTDLAAIAHPRLGYFGVLDERIDWALIEAVAQRHRDWQWTLVGPTAKVKEEDLPRLPNIHYLGQQQYADLPAFLKGFDIATMPFALNQATKFISPTKTLEYLAGGKQVISTSVPDVVAFYDQIVHLADGVDAWISAVERVLELSETERRERMERAEPVLEKSTWDSIAERMWALIEERLRQ